MYGEEGGEGHVRKEGVERKVERAMYNERKVEG